MCDAGVRIGEQDDKFLAAIAVNYVARSAGCEKHVGQRLQALVTRRMTVKVIVGLEVIGIDHDQRKVPAVLGYPVEMPLQTFLEMPPVGDAGHEVAAGRLAVKRVGEFLA